MTNRKWIGSPPSICDVCDGPITTEFSDAAWGRGGPWGTFCPKCAKDQGVLYGTSLGQRYVRNNDGEFEKVEG